MVKTLPVLTMTSRPITFSASETTAISQTPTIEYKPPLVTGTEIPEGLEKFYLTVEKIKKLNRDIEVHCEFGILPQGKAYSRLDNGKSRAFALVTIKYEGRCVYVLEVGRPDNRPLSTLIFWFKYYADRLDQTDICIVQILKRLIDDGGSWDVEWLSNSQQFSFSRLKHVIANTLTEWAGRILNKAYL